jgi:hypothetical protein
VHGDGTWDDCLTTVSQLGDDSLDTRAWCWRAHLFPAVRGMPVVGTGCVVAVQMSHAFADGVRSSALAARLLGRDGEIPSAATDSTTTLRLPWRGVAAARAYRRLQRDTAAGLVPPPAPTRMPLRTNAAPTGPRRLRTVVLQRDRIGPTVTVGVLAAIGVALDGHLRSLGDEPADLAAEVPMARAGVRRANNHYGNVGVGLYPRSAHRAALIAAELAARRRRALHPATAAEDRAFAAVPAPVVRWGVGQVDPAARPARVSGHTVVSSVNRGAADLRIGGAPVAFTAGFPALSPAMGLVHGLHGLGDVVVVSVHAAESAVGGPGGAEAYVDRLARALS